MADYLNLDSTNTTNNGTNNGKFFADLTFNGVGVTYVPAEFLTKGVVVNGVQYWDNGFTSPEVLKYMKPVEIDSSLLKNSSISKYYSAPTKGYIFDWGSASGASNLNSINMMTLQSYMTPITGMSKSGDSYQYVGVGDNKFSTYSPTTVHSEWSERPGGLFGVLADLGGAIASLGPAVLLADLIPGMQGIGTAIYVGSQLGQGNYKNAALAIAAANLPNGQGTTGMEGSMLEIPSIKNMATSLTNLGLDAAAANAVMTGGMKLIASGGNIEASFKEVLGNYVGAKAGDYVNAMKEFDGYKDLQTITSGVTKASTAAFMKNQDVGKAASTAFISTSIPVAFNSVPGFKDFQKSNPSAASAIINGAIATANGKDISLQATIRNSALDFMADRALSTADGYSSMTAAEKKAYKDLAIAQAQGKPINTALYDIMTAKVQAGVNEASAKKEGWDSYDQKQAAIAQYGKTITPTKFDEQTVTKDEALQFLKDAGLKRDPTETELANLMKGTELGAKQLVSSIKDVDSVTFDGTGYKTNEEALLAASKAGYNNFKSSDGNIYTIFSKDQYEKTIADAKKAGQPNPFATSKITDLNGNVISDVVNATEIPTVLITAKRLDAPTTYEGWLKDQKELKDLGSTNFPKWMSDQLNLLDIIVKANKDTKSGDAANLIEQAIAFGGRNFGSLTKQLAESASATGLVDYNNVVARTAAAIERWGNAAQNKDLTGAENAIINRVNGVEANLTKALGHKPTTAELAAAQAKEFVTAAWDNKLGALSLISGEALQELPFMAASGGVGKLVTGVMGKAAGYAAAMGTDGALNAAESFAGNYTDVYESLLKKGFSEEAAKAKAATSGAEAALVTFGTSLLGDNKLVKSFMGDVEKLSAGALTKEATKQYVTEYTEGMLQNASSQYAVNGKVDWAKATAAGAIEGSIGSAVSTGFITANGLNEAGIVGKDAKGGNVTLKEYLDGTKQPVTIDDNFNLSKDANNKITIGDAKNYYTEFTKNPDITSTEYFQTVDFFRDSGYGTPTSDEISKLVGGKEDLTNAKLQEAVNAYTDPYVIDKQELTDLFKAQGYSAPTDAELAKYAGKINESTGNAAATAYANSLAVTADEAKNALIAAGISKPTAAQIAQFTKTGKESDIISQLQTYANPLVVTEAEAKQAFADQGILNPTKEQLAQFVKEGDQTKILSDLTAYANPLATTEKEVRDAFAKEGIANPTKEQIAQFVKTGKESDIMASLHDYANPLGVTEAELLDVLKSEGYTKAPTKEELAKYTGALDQAKTLEAARSYYDPLAVTKEEATQYFKDLGYTPTADELNKFIGNLNEKDIAASITKTYDPLATTEKEVRDLFKSIGYTPTDAEVARYVGQKAQDVQLDLAKNYGNTALAVKELTGPINTRIDELVKSGQDYQTATRNAINELVSGNQELKSQIGQEARGANQSDLQEILDEISGKKPQNKSYDLTGDGVVDKSDATLLQDILAGKSELKAPTDSVWAPTGLYKTIADTQAADAKLLGDTTTSLNKRIDELVKQGQDYQTASQNAIAELTSGNKELQGKIGQEARGATQSDLQEILDEIAGKKPQNKSYDLTGNGVVDQSDAALLQDILAGKSELKAPTDSVWAPTGLYKTIADTQAADAKLLGETTTSLNNRIDELVKQGQDYQTATQNAIAELTTQNKGLTSLIGTEAKTATQADIDALTNMLAGKQAVDLSYDVNKDNQITQADIDALSKYVQSGTNTNPETNFDPTINTHWAPTGLYKTIYDQNIQRQKDLEAQKVAEAEAARKSNLQLGMLGVQNAINSMLPQVQALQTQAQTQAAQPPEVVQKAPLLDFGSPLDVGYFGESASPETDKEKLAQRQQGIVKIASGGSIDELLSLLYRG